ncbi:MAG: HNH endonuclease [Frankiaceae bacterium]
MMDEPQPEVTTPRKAISKRLRHEIMRRDNFTCRYCGATAENGRLTIDHVTPVALGGSDDPSNLVTACADCNAGKSSTQPHAQVVEDVRADDLRWARAMKRAAETMDAETKKWNAELDWFDAMCRFGDKKEFAIDRPGSWRGTYQQLRAAGLSQPQIKESMGIAMRSHVTLERVWAYFCGVAWNKVRKQQEIAQALIAAERDGEG